jgi:hypothetical protein
VRSKKAEVVVVFLKLGAPKFLIRSLFPFYLLTSNFCLWNDAGDL